MEFAAITAAGGGTVHRACAALAALCFALAASAVGAQPYPSKPVRVIVTLPPGSSIDVVTRIVTPRLTEALGEQFIVDNRAGATGNIAAELAARAAPNGYTVLMIHGGLTINPSLFPKLNYNLEKDFAPIGLIAEVPQVLTVHPSLPVNSIKELIAFLRQKPRQFQYGSNGNGSTPHLTMELFKMQAEIDVTHVPYKGTQQALADEIAGRIGMTFFAMGSVRPHVQAGRLRALGITSTKRSPVAPELPTFVESGLPGMVVNTWYGMLAPAGTPRGIVQSLNRELMNAVRTPDVAERLAGLNVNTVTSTPEEFAAYIRNEIAKWAKAVKASGAKMD